MERKCRLTVIGIWICLVLPLIVSEAKAQIRISKSSLTIEEGGKGSYKLHLDAPPSAEITLDITTTNSDVRVKPKSLTFTPDDWGKAWKITVEAIRDADAEDDHAIISHSVRTASNSRRGSANLQPASATVPSSLTVIVLDRYVPSHEVNISPSSGLSIRKGGSGNYSVSLIEKPDASVIVWASSDRSDVRVSPSSLTFYVGTWSSTRSFTVSVDADAASSSATISHSATSEDINYQGLTIDSLPVTVLQPPAGITQPPSRTKVLVGQTKTYYSPGLRSQPTDTVTINASSQAAGNATVTGSKSFGTGNWSTAQDFKVTGRSVGAATITYDVDSSDSRYDGYRLNSTSVTVEATTITCRADDVNIQLGGSSTLSWDSTNANSVTIDQGVGSVPVDSPQEGKTVTPLQPGAAETSKTTTYRFTAAGGGEPGTCSVTITVWRPPSVDSFSADLTTLRRQQTTRLSWATSHASSTTIDQGVGSVPVESSEEVRSVSPPQPSTAETSRSTSYTLTASNPGYAGADAASAAVSVTVWNRPSVDSFTASPSTIDEGEDSGLKWTTTHATGVSIDQGVGPVAVDDETGTTKVSPDQDTTYTLAASNPAYSGTHAVTDTVRVTVRRPTSSPGLSVSPTTLNITEGAAGKTYNVRLRTRPGHDVIVTVGIESGGDSRVQKNTSSLTFTTADWNRNQAVQVFAEEKSGTATGQARIANTPPSSYGGSAVDVTVNVADDDTDGCEATVMPTRLTIDEGENDGGYYDVVLAASPAASVTITLDLTGDPSLSADRSALTFTSGNWNTSQRVTIEAREDADYSDGRATIGHTASSTDEGCSGMSISSVSVNIRDDDEPPTLPRITLSSDEAGVSEPDGTAMVTAAVASGEEPAGDLTINLTHSGQATNGTDYTVATLTIGSGETSGNAELSVIDDKFAEGTEEIRLIANADSYRDSTPLSMNLTDDDSAGVTVTPTSLTIPEGGGLAYRVMLTSRPSHDVTVTVTHSGDRDIGIDDQELTFTDSDWETAQTVTVSAAQDDDARDDVATLSHSVASADTDYNGIAVPEVAVTVTDDETAGVKVAPTRLAIPEDASTTYTVALTSRPSRPVVVALSHSGDPDISANVAQVSFEPSEWDNPSTVTVQASRDPDAVDDTATLRHSASSSDSTYDGAPVDPVRITVGDLDSVGVNITPLNLTIDEGASRTYTVVLASKPSQDVVVEVDRTGDEDVVPQPDSLTFTGSNWQDPQAVTVQALQDPDAVDDTATLLHSTTSSDAAYGGLTVSDVSVSVIDDDTTGVNVSPLELAVLEGTSETCTVALASKPSAEVHISLNSNNNDVSPSPASLTFSPITWATAQEVMVPVAQDEDATAEVATLTFSATSPDPAYHGISVSAVSVDINDDDNAGVKVVPNPHMSVPEGESATYTIVLLSQPLATVAVAISSSNPQMLTDAFDKVTFTQDNWRVAQTVAFDTFHDDNTLDENEVLSHSAVSLDPNYKGISVTPLLVTITDRTAEKLTRTLPVLLSAMSGALAESIQTAVESRFERRRQMQRMKQDQGWWMPSYYQDRSRLSPEFNPSGGPETEPILSRASFGLPLAGNAFGGAHWRPVLWGHGDFQHFSGTSSLVDFRGRLSATHVGMDLLSNRHVLTGLSFARSWGAMGYSDDREGQLAASFNTFHPYLYWQPHRRLSLWGIGGMGRGSVDLRDPRLAHVFNSEFRMWAGGLRSVLTKPGKNELGFRLDGFMSNIAIDPVEQIREVFGRASRARAMLEAVHQRGGRKRSFSLKGEIGGRLDRGEAVHGAAMEAGLRLGFIDTPTGLDLSLQGRMLLFHDGGYRDWGAGLQASWDPGNKRRGLRMSAASSHGQNGRGGATLWDDSYAYAFGQGRGVPGNPVPLNRIGSEAAYSMEVLRGRGLLTPFSRLRWTGHGKELSVGSEFGLQPRSPDTNPLNMELEGIRGKSSRGPNMGVRIRMSIPF